VETEPYLLNVFTVEVDTSLSIKPIKGPIAAPLTFAEILPWAVAALIIMIILGGSIYYYNSRKNNQPIVIKKPRPKLPAHRIALDELERLKAEKLWQKDQVKAYHSRLTDILRIYIEDQFNIAALEMTTWETIRAFAGAKIAKSNLEILRETLEIADLVKFAKLKPMPEEHEKSMTNAINFVRQTTVVSNGNGTSNNIEEIKSKPEPAGVNIKSL
ncbi:MAG: post-transcriptional regulator, partial [Bacteroidales bacterium]|nr:post-transcriptional regulator [Bacteroidales bacterium]